MLLNYNTLLATFHAASRAPCSCHSVSSWDRSSNFGALGLRSWGSPGQICPSDGFWSRILVWCAIAFVNFTRWIGFGMSVPFRRIDFGGVMSWNTQPNCRASEDWRWNEFYPNFLSLFFPGFPGRSWYSSVTDSLLSITLLRHSYCTFVIILLRTFSSAVHQPDDVRMSTFHQTDNFSWSCRTNTLKGANFYKMNCCKFLGSNPCKAIATFYHLDFLL